MWITLDEAIVMFARYCRARFGDKAADQVRAKAKLLQKRGDTEGHRVWMKVAEEIDKSTKRSPAPSIHRHKPFNPPSQSAAGIDRPYHP